MTTPMSLEQQQDLMEVCAYVIAAWVVANHAMPEPHRKFMDTRVEKLFNTFQAIKNQNDFQPRKEH